MSSPSQDFILQVVFPSLGVCTGTFMCFAPYRAVLRASREGHLGDLNPTPWVFMLGNCSGWLVYAFLTQNVYIFLPNACGFILSIWLNIQAIKLQYENYRSHELRQIIVAALEDKSTMKTKEFTRIVDEAVNQETHEVLIIDPATTAPLSEVTVDDSSSSLYTPDQEGGNGAQAGEGSMEETVTMAEARETILDYAGVIWNITAQKTPAPASHELMVVAISTLWLALITVVGFPLMPEQSQVLLIGLVVNINLIFFYGAPLSKISDVLHTKSSARLHPPTMITATANGLLWSIYGVAVNDFFVAVPNCLGALMGLLQVLLFLRYRKPTGQTPSSADYAAISLETTPLL